MLLLTSMGLSGDTQRVLMNGNDVALAVSSVEKSNNTKKKRPLRMT